MRSPISFDSAEEDEDINSLVNLTPLLDVLFVVLILFIFIAPMLNVEHIALTQGGQKVEKVTKDLPLQIKVKADNSIELNKRSLSLEELKKELQGMHLKEMAITPVLIQDEKATFGTYQQIKNLLEDLGCEKLDIVVKR